MSNTKVPLSEQLPNDGSYHYTRVLKEVKEELKSYGKHGRRAVIKGNPKPGDMLVTQFSIPGKGQTQFSLDLQATVPNLYKAQDICKAISNQLVAGLFTEEWFYSFIGKSEKAVKPEKVELTGKQMIEQYKKFYFKQNRSNKDPNSSWYVYFRHIEEVLEQLNKPIALKHVRQIIESTENNSRTRTYLLSGLVRLLKYFDNTEFKNTIKQYKEENKPKTKKKHIPSDLEIEQVYERGFIPGIKAQKRNLYRFPQWRFLYGLLAVYGIRAHEAWNIKNWTRPVTLKDGDWLAVSNLNDNSENEEEKLIETQYKGGTVVIPAILDPKNTTHVLCIGHNTKTGYRMALPLSPKGKDWFKEFELGQPLNLPDIKEPLQKGGAKHARSFNCSRDTGRWFRRRKYGFTPHALRHAYNIRGHNLGITQKALANSLGHSLQMNSTTYLKHEGIDSKLQGQLDAFNQVKEKQLQDNSLAVENKALKIENERLRNEVTRLKLILQERELKR